MFPNAWRGLCLCFGPNGSEKGCLLLRLLLLCVLSSSLFLWSQVLSSGALQSNVKCCQRWHHVCAPSISCTPHSGPHTLARKRFPNLHGQSAFPKAWCFPKTLVEPLRGFIGLWVFLRRVCFRIWDIRIPETSYVLSRESVFQLRHRSHVRIPPKPRTARFRLNAPFAATYPLERNTRFARDCRPFFNKILREGRFARDCRPFFNNIPKR